MDGDNRARAALRGGAREAGDARPGRARTIPSSPASPGPSPTFPWAIRSAGAWLRRGQLPPPVGEAARRRLPCYDDRERRDARLSSDQTTASNRGRARSGGSTRTSPASTATAPSRSRAWCCCTWRSRRASCTGIHRWAATCSTVTSGSRCSSSSRASCCTDPSPRRTWRAGRARRCARYFRRRALRILPAYWVALTVIVYVLHQQHIRSFKEFVLLYGLLQIYSEPYHFHGIQQAWSLGTEVSFYLFLPLYAFGVRRLSAVGEGSATGSLWRSASSPCSTPSAWPAASGS